MTDLGANGPGGGRPYELTRDAHGLVARISGRGAVVLATPAVNRGTAFTRQERRDLGLLGLLPARVSTIDEQLRRTYEQYSAQPSDLRKWVYLATLRDRNEVLFHRLLSEHVAEMLPIVYTPTVGLAIERFSHEFRRSRGVFLSVDRPEDVEAALRNTCRGPDDVDLLVATDSEGILGIGDQGVGGVEIAIGKLSVYTAAAGIHPDRGIPVVLDTGTDNVGLLDDDMYLGERHPRIRDERYDRLIDAFVTAAGKLFPHALLHWEDFGATNARRILERYAADTASFNDDMQGTAAVVLAAVVAGVRATGGRMRDQRVVVHGAGTAGLGVADLLRDRMVAEGLDPREATRRFWALGRNGLLTEDRTEHQYDFQRPYARPAGEIPGGSLADVVADVRPTVLIGTSTQPGAFTEEIVRTMAAHTARPIILPLSNPTSRCEARPADLVAWTGGRALVATGSPFAPVDLDGRRHEIAQANNALVFPGLGLGVTVARARQVSAGMIAAAADAVAGLADATAPGGALLPPVTDLRRVSAAVAAAVVRSAADEGLAQVAVADPERQVAEAMWWPDYPRIEVVS
ncbi:NAD-dependent malic enzyme [Pseudonocardia sp.]|uniref:NAD-dependent malic enzyme n=1 Tax=Pseudonocardia sp. TaxID=60912 RepID=UPI003D0A488F